MRRMIAILFICLLLTGCGTRYEDAEDMSKTVAGGYFTLIKRWDSDDGCFDMVYAKDTKVKYLIWSWSWGHQAGITPLYNADGSLQIYEEGKEKDK